MLQSIKPKGKTIFFYMIVPVVWYTFCVFVPLITAMFYSLYEWKGGPSKTFIGLSNYVQLIKDARFWDAFSNNILLVLACIVGQVGIAFVFVLIINSRLVKFKGIHRTFGFFPSTVSAVCIGFIWLMIYDQRKGMLNWFLMKVGSIESMKDGKVWLNDPKIIMLLVAIPLVWQFIGYYMVILMSAIASVDAEIFEVAELDGANAFQRAIYIVLPLIKNTLLVCITLCVAGNMKAFDHIFTMTEGGPGTASEVMAMYGYNISFKQSNMGYGSAISVGIFIVSLIVIGGSQKLVNWIMRGKGTE